MSENFIRCHLNQKRPLVFTVVYVVIGGKYSGGAFDFNHPLIRFSRTGFHEAGSPWVPFDVFRSSYILILCSMLVMTLVVSL